MHSFVYLYLQVIFSFFFRNDIISPSSSLFFDEMGGNGILETENFVGKHLFFL